MKGITTFTSLAVLSMTILASSCMKNELGSEEDMKPGNEIRFSASDYSPTVTRSSEEGQQNKAAI